MASTPYAQQKWMRLSKAFIERYPLCVLCACRGEANAGATEFRSDRQRNLVVDHITPHRGDESLFWDQCNWQTLCRYPCHDVYKSRVEHREQDWYALLRDEMRESGSEQFVRSMQHLIPEHAMCRLVVVNAVA